MSLPNFLIIGAAKSGTTALTKFLQQHPQVHIPFKEPNYFSGWKTRIQFTAPPGLPYGINPLECATLEQYQTLFAHSGNARAIGEASVSYLIEPSAAANIKQLLPDVKLIVLLRQPVERAFSHYVANVRAGIELEKDFYGAIADEPARLRANWLPFRAYFHSGHYPEQLARYQQLFSPAQMKIYLYEDWNQRPQAVWLDLMDFLAIDRNFFPQFSERHNVGIYPSRFLKLLRALRPRVRWLFPTYFRRSLNKTLTTHLSYRPTLDPEDRRELTAVHFKDDILQLQDILQRDLSHWLQ